MPQQALHAAMLLLLGVVAWQDIKSRSVSAWVLLLLIALSVGSGLLMQGTSIWTTSLLNIGILAMQLGIVKLWFTMRKGRPQQLADELIGVGDLVFFIVPCVYLGTVGFVFYMLTAMLLSLVGALLWQQLFGNGSTLIPLAGIMSIVLAAVVVHQLIDPHFNRYNDIELAEKLVLW